LLNSYIKKLLPAWKSWKDSCYKIELEPRGSEMPCDCQRISVHDQFMYSGKYFKDQIHPHSPIKMIVKSAANGNAIHEYWDGTDGKSLFQGNIFGPTMWVVHESWGSCTPSFYGPEYNAGNRLVNPPHLPYSVDDEPLSQTYTMTYVCIGWDEFDENYWPISCACPLDVNGKMYLEATLMTNTDFRSNCFWETYSQADAEVAGLGLVRRYKPVSNVLGGRAGDVLFWNSSLASAQSSFKSRFNFGAPLQIFLDLTQVTAFTIAMQDIMAPQYMKTLHNSWKSIAPFKRTFATGPIKKNEILVDMPWRYQLEPNFPIRADLYTFYKLSAKGQDGWHSKSAIETRGLNTYFIEANEPSSGQNEYCCNDFVSRWFHSGEGGVWNTTMKNKVESFINMNNTVPWITVKTDDNYGDHFLSLGCSNFEAYVRKAAGVLKRFEYTYYDGRTLRWIDDAKEDVGINVYDIMGKLLYSNKLVPQKGMLIFSPKSFNRGIILVQINGTMGEQFIKILSGD
jgi:hypothetical protein